MLLICSGAVSAETVSLNTADSAPYSTMDSTGFYDVLLEDVFSRLGLGVHINHYPSERSIQWADEGHDDGEFARISGLSDTFDNLLEVREPLVSFQFVAVKRAEDSFRINGWEDLKNLRIGFLNGWKIYEMQLGSYPEVTRYDNVESMVNVLLAGRVDVILYSELRMNNYIRKNKVEGIEIIHPPLTVRTMHLYLHEDHAALVDKVNEQLREIKSSGLYEEYYKKYLMQ